MGSAVGPRKQLRACQLSRAPASQRSDEKMRSLSIARCARFGAYYGGHPDDSDESVSATSVNSPDGDFRMLESSLAL